MRANLSILYLTSASIVKADHQVGPQVLNQYIWIYRSLNVFSLIYTGVVGFNHTRESPRKYDEHLDKEQFKGLIETYIEVPWRQAEYFEGPGDWG